jgi:hypothetical protein
MFVNAFLCSVHANLMSINLFMDLIIEKLTGTTLVIELELGLAG